MCRNIRCPGDNLPVTATRSTERTTERKNVQKERAETEKTFCLPLLSVHQLFPQHLPHPDLRPGDLLIEIALDAFLRGLGELLVTQLD